MRDSPRSEQFASDMRSCFLCLLRYTGSSFTLLKILWACRVPGSKGQRENQNLAMPIFCDGSNTPARAVGGRKRATAHIGGELSLLR